MCGKGGGGEEEVVGEDVVREEVVRKDVVREEVVRNQPIVVYTFFLYKICMYVCIKTSSLLQQGSLLLPYDVGVVLVFMKCAVLDPIFQGYLRVFERQVCCHIH